jgi:hypothetical protein
VISVDANAGGGVCILWLCIVRYRATREGDVRNVPRLGRMRMWVRMKANVGLGVSLQGLCATKQVINSLCNLHPAPRVKKERNRKKIYPTALLPAFIRYFCGENTIGGRERQNELVPWYPTFVRSQQQLLVFRIAPAQAKGSRGSGRRGGSTRLVPCEAPAVRLEAEVPSQVCIRSPK